ERARVAERAVVVDLEDVRPRRRDEGEHPREASGGVRKLKVDSVDPAGGDEAALDDAGDDVDVDVAAADDRADAAGFDAGDATSDERGDRCGSRAFGDGLLLFEQLEDGVCDLLLAYGHDVVEVAAERGERLFADRAYGDAIAQRGRFGNIDDPAGFERGFHR